MRAAHVALGQLRACSGCAGDYEDPERTASRDVCDEGDTDEANAEAKEAAPRERFPVSEK